jgi:hypothetical protein
MTSVPSHRLYRRCSTDDSREFLIEYDWSGIDNQEWRQCVAHFLAALEARGHEVVALCEPEFQPGEDFVELVYAIGGIPTTFSSDHLLSLVLVRPQDSRVLHGAWQTIGDRVGWVC